MADKALTQIAEHYRRATGVACAIVAVEPAPRSAKARVNDHASADTKPPCNTCVECAASVHAKQIALAARFGGPYIYLCKRSLTFWAVPVIREGTVDCGLVAGPVRMLGEEDPESDHAPVADPKRVQSLAELLFMTASYASGSSSGRLLEAASALERESRMSEQVQELKHSGGGGQASYPVAIEAAFLQAIADGEVSRAQQHLNELLGHVFFSAGADIRSLRHRTKELVILLSRVTIEQGADPEEVLGWNYRLLDSVDEQQDINEIASWMSRVVRRFSTTVLFTRKAGHSRPLRRAVELVRSAHSDRIDLQDAAAAAGISPTYLSRLFRAELGTSFTQFLNRVRVEHADRLIVATDLPLSRIAAESGFTSQSYFNRVFKSLTGQTPGQARRRS